MGERIPTNSREMIWARESVETELVKTKQAVNRAEIALGRSVTSDKLARLENLIQKVDYLESSIHSYDRIIRSQLDIALEDWKRKAENADREMAARQEYARMSDDDVRNDKDLDIDSDD